MPLNHRHIHILPNHDLPMRDPSVTQAWPPPRNKWSSSEMLWNVSKCFGNVLKCSKCFEHRFATPCNSRYYQRYWELERYCLEILSEILRTRWAFQILSRDIENSTFPSCVRFREERAAACVSLRCHGAPAGAALHAKCDHHGTARTASRLPPSNPRPILLEFIL